MGQLQADFGLTSGQLWANFRQNLRTIYEDEPACVILTLLNIYYRDRRKDNSSLDKSDKSIDNLQNLTFPAVQAEI